MIKNTSFNVIPDKHTFSEIENLAPEESVIVYDKDNKVNKYWNGTVWETLSSNSTVISQKAANYSSLQDGTYVGDLAYCNQSEGTQWLPSTLGGTYYPAGWYLWNGTQWISDRNNISNQLQLNTQGLSDKANLVHTHVKSDITDFNDSDYASTIHTHVKSDITDFDDSDYAEAIHTHIKSDITDFNEGDYATQNQGALAETAIQPNDNVSELNNDSGFITSSSLGVEGLSSYFNELTYSNGDLTKIETWEDITKQTKLFTKNFTYSSGKLTQISLTNETTNSVENKTLSYDAQDNLLSITK